MQKHFTIPASKRYCNNHGALSFQQLPYFICASWKLGPVTLWSSKSRVRIGFLKYRALCQSSLWIRALLSLRHTRTLSTIQLHLRDEQDLWEIKGTLAFSLYIKKSFFAPSVTDHQHYPTVHMKNKWGILSRRKK